MGAFSKVLVSVSLREYDVNTRSRDALLTPFQVRDERRTLARMTLPTNLLPWLAETPETPEVAETQEEVEARREALIEAYVRSAADHAARPLPEPEPPTSIDQGPQGRILHPSPSGDDWLRDTLGLRDPGTGQRYRPLSY